MSKLLYLIRHGYALHNELTFIMIVIWGLCAYLGYKLTKTQHKQYLSYGIIAFALIQEVLDYVNRMFLDQAYVMSFRADLPLQFCHFGFYFSLIGIFIAAKGKKINPKIDQFLFDCAYVLGFGGALQAIITVDLTGVYNAIGIFTLNWQHSIIILNVLWLIFAYDKRFSSKGIFNAFLFINIIILPIGLINYILDANYMFICNAPNVNNVLLRGEWPYYLVWLEFIYFIYIIVLWIPFKIISIYEKQ